MRILLNDGWHPTLLDQETDLPAPHPQAVQATIYTNRGPRWAWCVEVESVADLFSLVRELVPKPMLDCSDLRAGLILYLEEGLPVLEVYTTCRE